MNSYDILTEDQKRAVDAAIGPPGLQGENLFINGPAGTGKTTVSNVAMAVLCEKYGDPATVFRVAPTNGATQLLKSAGLFMTLPKLFKTFPCDAVSRRAPKTPEGATDEQRRLVEESIRDDHWREVRERAKKTYGSGPDFFTEQMRKIRVVHIDEISMVSGRTLEAINYIMQESTGCRHLIFGGRQIILTGDGAQLTAVKSRGMTHDMFYPIREKESPKPFYDAVFRVTDPGAPGGVRMIPFDTAFTSYPLWVNFRVTKEDLFMRYLLEHVRYGQLDNLCMQIIQEMMIPWEWRKNVSFPEGLHPPVVHSRNEDVSKENNKHLSDLPGELYVIHPFDNIQARNPGVEKMIKHELDQRLPGEPCRLKVGATVILKSNLNPDVGLYYGATGIVTKITFGRNVAANSKTILGTPAVYVSFTTMPGMEPVAIGAAQCEYRHSADTIGTRWAVPLETGVSQTAHTCQGRSLDVALMDISHCFTEGQMYTALSRLRNWERGRIIAFNPRSLICNMERARRELDTMPAAAREAREKLFADVRALGPPRIPRKPGFEGSVPAPASETEPEPGPVRPEPQEPEAHPEPSDAPGKTFLFMCDDDYPNPESAVRSMAATFAQAAQKNAWRVGRVLTTCTNPEVLRLLAAYIAQTGCSGLVVLPENVVGNGAPEERYAALATEVVDVVLVVTTPSTCRRTLYQKVCLALHGNGKLVQMQTALPKN